MYYVYALVDMRKPCKKMYDEFCFLYEPFYIGKGHGKRYLDHKLKSRADGNLKKFNKLNKVINETKIYPVAIVLNNLNEEQAFKYEMLLIKLIGRQNLTNLTDGGEGCSGRIFTDITKDKISKGNKGKKRSQETKDLISRIQKGRKASEISKKRRSESGKGRIMSDEAKSKISAAKKGRPLTEEHKKSLSGRTLSDEHKAKLAAAKKGKKWSEEHRVNHLAAMQNVTHSEEAKARNKGRQKGKVLSEETKAKMAKARMGRKLSETHKKNITAKLIGNNWNLGKKQSQATISKRVEKSKETKRKKKEAIEASKEATPDQQ